MKTRILIIIQELFNFTHWKLQIETETTYSISQKVSLTNHHLLLVTKQGESAKKCHFIRYVYT